MKIRNSMIAIWIAVAMIVGLVGCLARVPDEQIVVQALRPHIPYMTHYVTETSGGGWALLVDLSDATNYPHVATNRLILKGIRTSGDLSDAKSWEVEIGVVTIVDTSGITVEHIAILPLLADPDQFTTEWTIPEHGINLLVSSDSLSFVATNSTTGTAIVTSTVMIEGVGGAAMPEVGDLILFTDETSDGATMRLSISTAYDTE